MLPRESSLLGSQKYVDTGLCGFLRGVGPLCTCTLGVQVVEGAWDLVTCSWVCNPTCGVPNWPGVGYLSGKYGHKASYQISQF